MPLVHGVAVVANGCLLVLLRILPFLGLWYLTRMESRRTFIVLSEMLEWRLPDFDEEDRLPLLCILIASIFFTKLALFGHIAAFDNYEPMQILGNGTVVGWWISWADGWAVIEELRQR